MIAIKRSEYRGHLNHGWLDTYHSFSFGEYYDPRNMGYRSLRVINEDVVAPGQGFGTHPHRDMEIITYVLEGALEHRDSMGSHGVIRPGEIQRMSAGTGVRHSEFNHSKTEPVHLLQIWIMPDTEGVKPSYEEKKIATEPGKLQLMAAKGGTAHPVVRIHPESGAPNLFIGGFADTIIGLSRTESKDLLRDKQDVAEACESRTHQSQRS